MSWVKLDDRFHENRKIRRIWRRHPVALGLHTMALTYCAGNLTDGIVPVEFVEDQFRDDQEEHDAVQALVDAGLWHPVADGWEINDFLEFNPSRQDSEERAKSRSDAARKAARARWGDKQPAPAADSAPEAPGQAAECDPDASPHASTHMRSMRPHAPDPARPVPNPTVATPPPRASAREAAAAEQAPTVPTLAAVPEPLNPPPPLVAPPELRTALEAAGFNRLTIDQADGAICHFLAEFAPPADVDWWRTGQEIRRLYETGKLRTDRPDSALRFLARSLTGLPRRNQPDPQPTGGLGRKRQVLDILVEQGHIPAAEAAS